MITKIEIDGFKTFSDFVMEFAPLTVIAGANASGKSNLFDAMQLLTRIVETDLKTAFSEQRGDANELFTLYPNGQSARKIKFEVELLVDKTIKDRFGGNSPLKYTRLTYKIEIGKSKNERGNEDLVILSESLNPIRHENDTWIKKYINHKNIEQWRPKVKTGKRGIAYIDSNEKGISLRQDGGGGMKREFPLSNINQAVLSIVNSVDFPHALATKEEIKNWKFLQLSPEDLRKPSSYLANDSLTHTGQNLASTLNRIKQTDNSIMADITRRLNSLLPGIIDVDVIDDKVGKQFVVQVKTEDGRDFTSRVLSEGTLRLLTLCIFLYDPLFKGAICFEEPENGIHPGRMKTTAGLLEDLVCHFDEREEELRQVIVNTHSPVLVGEIFNIASSNKLYTIWFSELVTNLSTVNDKRQKTKITKMTPVIKGNNQLPLGFTEQEQKYTLAKVKDYLLNADFGETIKTI